MGYHSVITHYTEYLLNTSLKMVHPQLLTKSSSIFVPPMLLRGLKNFQEDQHRNGGMESKGT